MGTRATTRRVAVNVRAELSARRIHGTELARYLGISLNTMYRRLDGESAWPVDDLEQVADFLDLPVMALLAERGDAA